MSGGGSDAFECCSEVKNCVHEFVCWGVRGICDQFVLERDGVTETFAVSGLDVTFLSAIMPKRSAKIPTIS